MTYICIKTDRPDIVAFEKVKAELAKIDVVVNIRTIIVYKN